MDAEGCGENGDDVSKTADDESGVVSYAGFVAGHGLFVAVVGEEID